MKKLLPLFCVVALLLGGCGMFDSLLLRRAIDERGVPEVRDVATGEVIPEDAKLPGHTYEPAYSSQPSVGAQGLQAIVQAIPGVGQWIGAGIGAFVLGYGAVRGAKRVFGSDKKAFIQQIIADIHSGALDSDKDGKISLAEIGGYISSKASSALSQGFLDDVIAIVTNANGPEGMKAALLALTQL